MTTKSSSARSPSSEACRLSAQCVPFAVRSGGHSPNPYWSSIGFNGIVISITNLDTLTVSSDNSIESIDPGLRWGAVKSIGDQFETLGAARNSNLPYLLGMTATRTNIL
ncbi:hypothetical protein BHYA_0089g00170 [Botrytis hyacinthi]|uniref:FAD linked oxidase N-terminal domain-containing protein n=1 Tax=Botrytis hyacinthi TaxID=278943 RepID=A0A4Z1GN94_9HELO|nr:hypothetical protein BHYA_0089g00170 [Botrytis hyacinthi]